MNSSLSRRMVAVFVILLLITCICSCANQGKQIPSTQFEYEIIDGCIVLTKYFGSDTKVVVPASIDGYRVSTTTNTFEYNTTIEEIVFSEGIEHIGEATCNFCLNLKNVSIPNSAVNLGANAFSNTGISTILLPKNIKSIGEECFARCRNLKKVVSEADRITLADRAFSFSNSLFVMQVESQPEFENNTFSSKVEFTHSNIGSFLVEIEELLSASAIATFSKWFNQQPEFIQVIMMSGVIWLIILVVLGFLVILNMPVLILKKRKRAEYKKYCRTYEDGTTNNAYFFRYKKLAFFSERLIHSFLIIIAFLLIGLLFAAVGISLAKGEIVHDMLLLTLMLFAGIFILTSVALLIFAFPIIKSKLIKISLGRGHRVRGRVRKISKRNLYYDK